jgi:hypothetical protein
MSISSYYPICILIYSAHPRRTIDMASLIDIDVPEPLDQAPGLIDYFGPENN